MLIFLYILTPYLSCAASSPAFAAAPFPLDEDTSDAAEIISAQLPTCWDFCVKGKTVPKLPYPIVGSKSAEDIRHLGRNLVKEYISAIASDVLSLACASEILSSRPGRCCRRGSNSAEKHTP